MTLGELGTFIRGNGLQKKDLIDQGKPAIHYGQIYTHYGISANSTKSYVSEELFGKLRAVPKGALLMTTTSENIEDVCKTVAWLGDDELAFGGHSCGFVHDQDPMFMAFLTQTTSFQKQKDKFVKGTKVKDISTKDLEKIQVPVPSVFEQQRISRLISCFYELANDISLGIPAELQARRKQYEYYRDKLLTFKELAA